MPRASKSRRKLAYRKCKRCRLDKAKCLPEDRQWPGPRCLRCERFDYTCSESCTKAQEVLANIDSTQSSGNAAIRGFPSPEDIHRSESVESIATEHTGLDRQLSTCDSENLEPSTYISVKTDDELISDLGVFGRLMDSFYAGIDKSYIVRNIKELYDELINEMNGRAERYSREGQPQRCLDLYSQARQVLSEASTEHQTRFRLDLYLHCEACDSHDLVEDYISRKNFYKAEVLLEDLVFCFADDSEEEYCLCHLSKLIELYTLSVERINRMPIEGIDSEAKKLLASMLILDRIARIDVDRLSNPVIDERLVKFQKGTDLGMALYCAVQHSACNLARTVFDRAADFGATFARSLACGTSNGSDPARQPLHEAVDRGHIDMVRLLVARGADLEAEELGLKPLQIAVIQGRLAIVVYLLSQGANIEASCPMEKTPLILAVDGKHTEILQYLLERGADLHKIDELGWTALHHAVFTQNSASLRLTECIDGLVDHGIDVDAKNAAMETALHLALIPANTAAVEHLISKGASLTAESCQGTALHIAVLRGYEGYRLLMVQALLRNGADINRRRSSDGKTPLHVAVCDLVTWGHNDLSFVSCLLAHRPDASILDDNSKSALDYAIGNEAATAMLMQYLSMPPAHDQGQSDVFDFR
ncbi:MAG: hypothetical protein L6R36_009335 [Xanthoria steineri]|nr:MAG: hypothetical protein L6R36_009335 [Xanthoria steineri]